MKPWTFRKLLRGRGDTTQQSDDATSIVLPRSLPAADSRRRGIYDWKTNHRKGETAGKPAGLAVLGRIRVAVASCDERDYLLAGYRGKSGDARWKKDDAGFLRFELSGRSLRLLRHAGERQGSHGMFGAGGQTGAADSA